MIDNRIVGYWDALAKQHEMIERSLTWWKKIAFLILDQERYHMHMPLNETLGWLLDTKLETIKLGLKNLEGNFDEGEFKFKLMAKYWPTALAMSWINESPSRKTFGEDIQVILKPLYEKFESFLVDVLRDGNDDFGDGLQLYNQLIGAAGDFIGNIAGKDG